MDDDLRKLRRALDTMPEPERQVFARARFEQLDHVAIAAALGLSIREVERRLASAMLHLMTAEE